MPGFDDALGADKWEDFAGDTRHLTLASPGANESKGDRGPADWLPPRQDARYWYATTWIRTPRRYGLRFSAAEIAVLGRILRG